MCGVIVIDAGRSRSTCLGRDAYTHDHCLEYRHNYARFYQLPNSNLLPTVCFYSREKVPVKTMALESIFIILISYYLVIFFAFLLCLYFTLHLYHKNTKNIILSYLSDLTLVSGPIGIDNPYLRWLQGFICFVQVRGTRA